MIALHFLVFTILPVFLFPIIASPQPQLNPPASALPAYQIIALGLPEEQWSVAQVINDRGQVAGIFMPKGATRASVFLWEQGQTHLLKAQDTVENYPGDQPSVNAINSQGDLVGVADHQGFLYHNGKMQRLLPPGAARSVAYDINDKGQVIGVWRARGIEDESHFHSFLYHNGKFKDLGAGRSLYGINNKGEMVGVYYPKPDKSGTAWTTACLYRNGKWIDNLGTLASADSRAYAITDQGDVLGTSRIFPERDNGDGVAGYYEYTSFLWRKGMMRPLQEVQQQEGRTYVFRSDANYASSYPDVYANNQEGKITNVNSLLPVTSHWKMLRVTAQNRRRQIVGTGMFEGKQSAFLLTPQTAALRIPTPTPQAALILNRMTRADSQPVDSPPHYTITKVQGLAQTFNAILPGKEFLACNERGQVAGIQNVGAVSSNAAVFHAAIWKQGQLIGLGVPQGYRHSYASAINNVGQVVGWAVSNDEKRVGSVRAWIWDKQGFHLLPLLSGMTDSAATAVNDRGQVVGIAYKRDCLPGQLNWQTPCRGFVWQDGKMADLGTPNAKYPHIIPTAINATGEIAGQATGIVQMISSSAFLWRNGAIQLLNQVTTSTEEIGAGYVNALNNRGQIIGLGSIGVNMAGDILHPFLWDSGKLSRLQITGAGINDRGNVVGTLADKEGHLRAALRANDQAYDLNTLLPGGSGWRLLSASSINNKGEILGNGVYKGKPCVYLLTPAVKTGAPSPHAATPPSSTVRYTVTCLDALSSEPLFFLTVVGAINNRGQVCGWVKTTQGKRHACLWEQGRVTDLGTLGGDNSEALAINDMGQVTGWADTGKMYVDFTSTPVRRAFLWQSGKMIDLGTLSGDLHSAGLSINNHGQVFGQAIGFPEPVDLDTGQRPEAIRTFLWQNGKLRVVNTPLGMGRINIRGNGAGWEEIKSSPATYRVVIWGKGGKTALPAFGSGKIVVAARINDMGQALTQTSQGDYPTVTTLWTGRHWQLVGRGLLGNHLNNKGQVVGHTEGKPERQSAFVWQNGTRTDLNSFLPDNSGWTLREAVSINDRGQIVGTGMYQGQSHAFLLTPVQK